MRTTADAGRGRGKVVYVLGSGHCGSTLLSLLLNGVPGVLAVSELSKLHHALAADDPVLKSAPWQAARLCFEARTGSRFDAIDLRHPSLRTFVSWNTARVERWARPRAVLLDCLTTATGAQIIIDASKAWQQLYLLHRSNLFELRVIHLVRDGRAVVHAYQRKHGDLARALGHWLKPSIAAPWLRRAMADRWMTVRYEDLASSPQPVLRAVCGFIGVGYDPSMLHYRRTAWLGIGGNRMSKHVDERIRVDESWRTQMLPRHRVVVCVVGGAVNRYYGY